MDVKKTKILVPNFFTSFNLVLGFTSVYFSFGGKFTDAAWIILFCVLMDKLDGTTARLFKASSEFGVEFDSFSDFFSFGIAPAFLFFSYFYHITGKNIEVIPFYIKVAVAIYVLLTAIRLAKFNSSGKEDPEYFYGMTSTQSGAMLAAFFLLGEKYEFTMLQNADIMSGMLLAHGILLVASYFKYPKIKKRNTKLWNTIQIAVFVFLVLLVLFRAMPELIYFTGIGYITVGTFITRRAMKRKDG